MSVSSMSTAEEITLMEGTSPVPSEISFDEEATQATLATAVLDHACVENDRLRTFYVSGFFANDDILALAAKGKLTGPSDIFGKVAKQFIWCTVNIECNDNGTYHFHATAETKSQIRIHTILNSMRSAGTTVNTESEGLFKHSFIKMDRPRGNWKKDRKWLTNITNVIWYCQKDKTQINHFETGLFDGRSPTDAMKHIRKTMLKGNKASKEKKEKKGGDNTVDAAIDLLNDYLLKMKHYESASHIRKRLFADGHSDVLLKHGNKIDEMIGSYKALAFPRESRVNQGWFAWFGAPECGKTYGVNKWSRFMVADALGEEWNEDEIPLRSIVHRFNLKEAKTSYTNEPILQCEEFFGDVLKLNDFKEINPIGTDDHTFSMPVKYKVEQATFNHIAMAITSNHWPLDWYRGVFGGPNGDTEYQAFMRRCGGLYFFPKYRITDDSDPTSVERDESGKPVVNKVVLDGPNLVREAQWVDLTSSLRLDSFAEALKVKRLWADQLNEGIDDVYDNNEAYRGPLRPGNYQYALQGNPAPGHRSW